MNELGNRNSTHPEHVLVFHQSDLVQQPAQAAPATEVYHTPQARQAKLETEEQLRREKQFLLAARCVLGSMPDRAFELYCRRVSAYLSAFNVYMSHLTHEELKQLSI